MEDDVLQFYEEMVGDYHLIFADWKQGVLWQGEVLDRLIRAQAEEPAVSVLDCSCGIGTQAIGLAARGYRVHATDISAASVERARREAASFGVSATFGVSDFRELTARVEGMFDVVISCDNALPHLSSDDDLLAAARNMKEKLRPHGLLLASIRDYDQVASERPRSTLPRVFDDPEGRRIVFQVWNWSADGKSYRLHQFIITEERQGWRTAHYTTCYSILLRDDLSRILTEAGFSEIRWHRPEESGYYQPIVTARKV
ncbi:MAG: class I SAM-dependent methyltransferase [Blastocatellia bacterium]|nr:class I SAM-dependent methyltransferase [Blastocatellia bacterium]